MIKAYSAENIIDANIVSGLFKARGIECVVKGDTLVGIQGEVPPNAENAPSVWLIDEADYVQARAIVKDFESSPPETLASWSCESCGEENEGQFMQCWSCQSIKEA